MNLLTFFLITASAVATMASNLNQRVVYLEKAPILKSDGSEDVELYNLGVKHYAIKIGYYGAYDWYEVSATKQGKFSKPMAIKVA